MADPSRTASGSPSRDNPWLSVLTTPGLAVTFILPMDSLPTALFDFPAKVVGQIECQGGIFHNPDGIALSMDDVSVGHSVFLKKPFHSSGEVRLVGAAIVGNLECQGGQFTNPGKVALQMERIEIGGDLYLRDSFESDGEIALAAATVKGNIECIDASLRNPGRNIISAENLQVHEGIIFGVRHY